MTEYTGHLKLPIPEFGTVPWHTALATTIRAIDSAFYEVLLSNNIAAWTNDTDYEVSDFVLDETTGKLWVAGVAHTSSPSPTLFITDRLTNPTYWNEVLRVPGFRGAWVTGTTYNEGDFVTDTLRYAVANDSHVGGASFNIDLAGGHWTVLVDLTSINNPINTSTEDALVSGAAIDLGSVDATRVLITGTGGPVTNFGSSPDTYKILRFADAVTITANASIVPPSGVNYTTVAGDIMIWASDGAAKWYCLAASPRVYMMSVSNTDRLLGRSSPGAGAVEEITCTAAARSLLDDTTVANMRATLGLGTSAVVNAGTAASQMVQLDASARIPAVDGSLITKIGKELGQCRLTKSGANLLLSPVDGNKLFINGTHETIPSAGVTLAPPATSGTLYYIYAFMSAGTMTLEASTTAYATDTTHGHKIKSADATRTLVGMARTVSSAWVDTALARLVISWFNQRLITAQMEFGSNRTTAGAAFVELGAGSDRLEFLVWSGVTTQHGGTATINSSGGNGNGFLGIGIDSATAIRASYASVQTAFFGNVAVAPFGQTLAEGYHYQAPLGGASAFTMVYNASYTSHNVALSG